MFIGRLRPGPADALDSPQGASLPIRAPPSADRRPASVGATLSPVLPLRLWNDGFMGDSTYTRRQVLAGGLGAAAALGMSKSALLRAQGRQTIMRAASVKA